MNIPSRGSLSSCCGNLRLGRGNRSASRLAFKAGEIRLSLRKGEGLAAVQLASQKPLTSILSPSARGEALDTQFVQIREIRVFNTLPDSIEYLVSSIEYRVSSIKGSSCSGTRV